MSKKEKTTSILLEPLLLYLVLFFPGLGGFGDGANTGTIPFSAIRELSQTLHYTLPALALIWYLILKKKSLSFSPGKLKPDRKDAYSFLFGFPGLILIGAGISLIITRLSLSSPQELQGPYNIPGWITLIFSCLGTGYLEESYFRYYLLRKLEERVSKIPRVIFSVLLFALCHAYEGPWGILNAALAGLLLSFLFERCRSLHGIALAHACYNALVYALGNYGL